MKKKVIFPIIIIVFVVVVVLIIFFINSNSNIKIGEKSQDSSGNIFQTYGLGSLCSGEDGCKEFCSNNRGRCEDYCKEEENELCSKIFPTYKIPSCANRKELFTVSPVSFGDLDVIVPLGSLNPPSHIFPTDHMYFNVKHTDGTDGMPLRAKVISPGDVHLVKITSAEHVSAQPPYTDYDLEFYPCEEVYARFGHVTSLSERLQASFDEADGEDCTSYNTGGSEYRRCTKQITMQLQAGEEIGTTGGFRGAAAGIDFWLADYRIDPITYANPTRWGELSFYITCPLDYFTAAVKDNLFAIVKNRRTIEPVCGTIAQDVIGRAQGTWFVEKTQSTFPEDLHVALVHDNFNPLKGVFSIGTSITGLDSKAYFFDPEASGYVNRDFKDVMPGKIYCYDSLTTRFDNQELPFRILIEMTSDTKIIIEKQDESTCGSGPWNFDKGVEFER